MFRTDLRYQLKADAREIVSEPRNITLDPSLSMYLNKKDEKMFHPKKIKTLDENEINKHT